MKDVKVLTDIFVWIMLCSPLIFWMILGFIIGHDASFYEVVSSVVVSFVYHEKIWIPIRCHFGELDDQALKILNLKGV